MSGLPDCPPGPLLGPGPHHLQPLLLVQLGLKILLLPQLCPQPGWVPPALCQGDQGPLSEPCDHLDAQGGPGSAALTSGLP